MSPSASRWGPMVGRAAGEAGRGRATGVSLGCAEGRGVREGEGPELASGTWPAWWQGSPLVRCWGVHIGRETLGPRDHVALGPWVWRPEEPLGAFTS